MQSVNLANPVSPEVETPIFFSIITVALHTDGPYLEPSIPNASDGSLPVFTTGDSWVDVSALQVVVDDKTVPQESGAGRAGPYP